jgi:hypothetical protein
MCRKRHIGTGIPGFEPANMCCRCPDFLEGLETTLYNGPSQAALAPMTLKTPNTHYGKSNPALPFFGKVWGRDP